MKVQIDNAIIDTDKILIIGPIEVDTYDFECCKFTIYFSGGTEFTVSKYMVTLMDNMRTCLDDYSKEDAKQIVSQTENEIEQTRQCLIDFWTQDEEYSIPIIQ